MPLWRSLHSLNLMLPKEERKAMLLRLYNEVIPLQDNSKARFEKKKNVNKESAEGVTTNHANGDGETHGTVPDGQEDLQAIIDATSDEEASLEESTVETGVGAGAI